jgi:uncharacterized protein (TIGR04255 family)
VRRQYKKPSVAEVVCEFQFVGSHDWDWTIPGLLYQEVMADFPVKRQEKAFEVNIAAQEGTIHQNLAGSLSKIQFVREDKSAMVQVGPDLLAVNVSGPYPGWETFSELVQRHFDLYSKIAQPSGFKRIGLRYINKFIFPTANIETTDYFDFYPHLPKIVEQKHGPFSMRVLYGYGDEPVVLNLQMGNIPSDDKNLGIALDLDYYLVKSGSVKLADGLGWVKLAHQRIEDMFEACITHKTRQFLEVIP